MEKQKMDLIADEYLKCLWEFDEFSGAYFFTCDGQSRAFTFMNSLKEDGFKFCPYCGRPLEEK